MAKSPKKPVQQAQASTAPAAPNALTTSLTLVTTAYPAITSPLSGSTVAGGTSIDVTVHTNLPTQVHTLNVYLGDGTTSVCTTTVTFPNNTSPGTARITLPAAGTGAGDYILEVVPAAGQTNRIVVRVPAATAVLAVSIAHSSGGPGPYTIGQQTFTATQQNGSGQLFYDWTLFRPNKPPATTTDDDQHFDFNFGNAATGFNLRVVVRDSSNPVKTAVAEFGPFDIQ